MDPQRDHRHVAAVLLASVLWGTTGTVAHQASADASQLLVGVATFGFGGLVLFGLDAPGAIAILRDRAVSPLLLLAAAGVVAYASMYYVSMALVGVAVGNVLALGSGPVFAAVLELVVEHRPIRRAWAVATTLTVAGVWLLGAAAGSRPGSSPLLGVLLGLGAGFAYALYSWSAARVIAQGQPSRSVMAAMFGAASVILLPVFVLGAPGPLLEWPGPAILLYLAAIPMAAAYLLFGYGLRGLAASTATTLALAEPVVATLLATAVLGERLGASSWMGIALILAGLVLVVAAERHDERSAPRSPTSAPD